MSAILPDKAVATKQIADRTLPLAYSGGLRSGVFLGVTANPTVVSVIAPSRASQVWEPAQLFPADWAGPVTVSTAYSTVVEPARSVSEQRRAGAARPRRTVSYNTLVYRDHQVGSFFHHIARLHQSRFVMPIWSDFVVVTNSGSGSGVLNVALSDGRSVSVDEWYARRFVDTSYSSTQRLCIVRRSPDGVSYFAFFFPGSVSVSSSTVQSIGVSGIAWQPGDRVYPVVECDPLLSAEIEAVSARAARAVFAAQEYGGPSALPPSAAFGIPAGFSAFDGSPILDLRPNFRDVRLSFLREGELRSAGSTTIPDLFGSRGRFGVDVEYRSESRVSMLRLRRLFDARAGRLGDLFVCAPTEDIRAVAVTSSSMDVRYDGSLADITRYRRYLAVWTNAGALHVREVLSSSVVSAGVVRLNWSAGDPLSVNLSQVRDVAWAARSRFSSDELEEVYLTDGVSSARVSFVELLEERAVDLLLLETPVVGEEAGPPAWSPCNQGVAPPDAAFSVVWYNDLSESIPIGGSYPSFYIDATPGVVMDIWYWSSLTDIRTPTGSGPWSVGPTPMPDFTSGDPISTNFKVGLFRCPDGALNIPDSATLTKIILRGRIESGPFSLAVDFYPWFSDSASGTAVYHNAARMSIGHASSTNRINILQTVELLPYTNLPGFWFVYRRTFDSFYPLNPEIPPFSTSETFGPEKQPTNWPITPAHIRGEGDRRFGLWVWPNYNAAGWLDDPASWNLQIEIQYVEDGVPKIAVIGSTNL